MKIEKYITLAMPIAQVGSRTIRSLDSLRKATPCKPLARAVLSEQYHQDAGIPNRLCQGPFQYSIGRPKGCNRLEDDALSSEMMDSIPAISEPADYYPSS